MPLELDEHARVGSGAEHHSDCVAENREPYGAEQEIVRSRRSDDSVSQIQVPDSPHAERSGRAGAAEPVRIEVQEEKESFIAVYLRRLKGGGEKSPPWLNLTWDLVPSFLFTGITMTILAILSYYGLRPHYKEMYSFIPSLGASCALVFCLSTTPGSQPRALVGTHVVGATLGLSFMHATRSLPRLLSEQLGSAFGVSILTPLMMATGTLQPSASATTCLAAFHDYGEMNDQGYMFVVTPALLGSVIVVLLGWVFNNTVSFRPCYPVWW